MLKALKKLGKDRIRQTLHEWGEGKVISFMIGTKTRVPTVSTLKILARALGEKDGKRDASSKGRRQFILGSRE